MRDMHMLEGQADTRTNAGIDRVSTFPKLFTFESPGERAIMLSTSGNLAISQPILDACVQRGVSVVNLPFNALRMPVINESGQGESRPERVVARRLANGKNAVRFHRS